MEYQNGILCITGEELIGDDNLLSKSYYDKLARQGRINILRRGCYGTPALIEYDSLPIKYRRMYESKFGNPHKKAEYTPFIQRIKPDAEALQFFTDYRYDDVKALPMDRVKSYCNDVAILNALKDTLTEYKASNKAIGRNVTNVWRKASELVENIREFYPCNMPKTDITLHRKYKRYQKEGYYAIIHAGYGNRNSAKVDDKLSTALLMELLSHGNQLAAPLVAETYNLWAEANGRESITEATVNNFKTKYEYEIMSERNGKKVWADKYDKVIKRNRPSAPLLLINSDDNDLDLYFRANYTKKVKGQFVKVKNDYYRFKLYVVMDAHCDYILGYAFGDQITKEVIYSAYRNAMNHIKELTGSYYLWDQTVADRWGLSSAGLKSFYESIATFTPPTAGLARSKVIERSFGAEWHGQLKRFPNYAGSNITAKSKANSDYIASHIKTNPTVQEGEYQIAQFIEKMRSLEWAKSGMSRKQVWLKNFKDMAISKQRLITTETYLSLFGQPHTHFNKITNSGVNIIIDGNRFTYDVPEHLYRSTIGKRVKVYYELDNLSRVLVTDGGNLRFVATENTPMPMAFADMRPGDRQRLEAQLDTKKQRRKEIINETDSRRALLDRAKIDAESLLQAGVLIKETRFNATAITSIAKINNGEIDENTLSKLM